MRKRIIFLIISSILTILFTVAVLTIDVTDSGLLGTRLGFSSLNLAFFSKFSGNTFFYKFSEFLGYLLVLYPAFFVGYILFEWKKKKSLYLVDPRLLLIISVYAITILFYLLFTKLPINYRPVFEEGVLETSFPSSHVLLALVACGSSVMATNFLFTKKSEKTAVMVMNLLTILLAVVIVVFRAFSGVHWLTDIIGGILYSATILSAYSLGIEALTFLPKSQKPTKILRARRASDLHKSQKPKSSKAIS